MATLDRRRRAPAALLYLLVSVYKFRLTFRALGTHLETDVTDEEVAALDERTLPIYTILVPLYKEAGIVRRLVRGINELDWPRTRLDVKLLCEEDDVETIEKIRSLQPAAALPPRRRARQPAEDQAEGLQLRSPARRPAPSASSSTPRTARTPTS